MNREEVFIAVQDIFKDIFDEDDMVVESITNPDLIEEWDSLNHINLIAAIEKEFEIKFPLQEIMELNNVGVIIDLVMTKLK